MRRYAALLRGIMPSNPQMSNENLRGVFNGLGFRDVASLLASGNLVFRAEPQPTADLEARIQRALRDELAIPGGTIIRGDDELSALIATDPFAGRTHGRGSYLTATFLQLAPGASAPELPAQVPAGVEVSGYDDAARALLLVVDNSIPRATPDFMTALKKTYGEAITTRTWPTLTRIAAKLQALPA